MTYQTIGWAEASPSDITGLTASDKAFLLRDNPVKESGYLYKHMLKGTLPYILYVSKYTIQRRVSTGLVRVFQYYIVGELW